VQVHDKSLYRYKPEYPEFWIKCPFYWWELQTDETKKKMCIINYCTKYKQKNSLGNAICRANLLSCKLSAGTILFNFNNKTFASRKEIEENLEKLVGHACPVRDSIYLSKWKYLPDNDRWPALISRPGQAQI
jgi:hypothetical protein